MEKWHTQFDKLRKQWSDYNWLDNEYKPHSKQLVAKIGVAWVVKIPEADFQDPVGWEVEIIDTPVGISERSHKLIKWLRNPPHFYDRLSTYNDSSNSTFEEPYWIKKDIRPNRNFSFHLANYWPNETFTIPANEYEIFKKTCCQCKERSFKNTSTNYDSETARLYKAKNHSPIEIPKNSPLDEHHNNLIQKQKNEEHKFDKMMNTVSNRNTHNNIENEINDQIINDSNRFSISRSDQGNARTKDKPDSTRISTLADKSIETSRVAGRNTVDHNQGRSSRLNRFSSLENQILSKESIDNWNGYRNHHDITHGEYEETGVPNKLETTSRKRISSIDVFDDGILSRLDSLEDYRDFENGIFNNTSENMEYKSPTLNTTRNRHQRHDENQSREHVGNMSKVNFVPSNNEIGSPKMVDAESNVTRNDLIEQ